jgi:hypothetical protein
MTTVDHFKTGQYIDYRGSSGRYIPGTTGVSHCDVMVSICNAMGIQTDTFGEQSKCYGPLQGISLTKDGCGEAMSAASTTNATGVPAATAGSCVLDTRESLPDRSSA